MSGPGVHPYHQQWPVAQPPHMAYETSHRPAADEVRTIFISGLPPDVKERELVNLLRWLPGYEASQVNYKGEQPMGFALFTAPHFALAAKDALQNMVFDAEMKSMLHTEMAKKNLFIKRGVVGDQSFDQSKKPRTGGDYTHSGYTSPAQFHPVPSPMWGPEGYIAASAPYDPYGGYPIPPVAMPGPAPVSVSSGYAPALKNKDNPPCNTLFIGNLGENIIDEELKGLFSVQPGYKQMKIVRQERNAVCFIEFEDVDSASNVHQNMQGVVISSSDRGGLRIQFSKNPFGKRKDSNNGVVATDNGGVPVC